MSRKGPLKGARQRCAKASAKSKGLSFKSAGGIRRLTAARGARLYKKIGPRAVFAVGPYGPDELPPDEDDKEGSE